MQNKRLAHATIKALIEAMRAAKRDELIHYAGAANRDRVAWHVCWEWEQDRHADEATLKSRALLTAYGWTVSPAQIRANNTRRSM